MRRDGGCVRTWRRDEVLMRGRNSERVSHQIASVPMISSQDVSTSGIGGRYRARRISSSSLSQSAIKYRWWLSLLLYQDAEQGIVGGRPE